MEVPSFTAIFIKVSLVVLLFNVLLLRIRASFFYDVRSYIFSSRRLLYIPLIFLVSIMLYSFPYIGRHKSPPSVYLGQPVNANLQEAIEGIFFMATCLLLFLMCIIFYDEGIGYLRRDRLKLFKSIFQHKDIIDAIVRLAKLTDKDIISIVETPEFIDPFLAKFDKLFPYILKDMDLQDDCPVMLDDKEKKSVLVNWILHWIMPINHPNLPEFREKIRSIIKQAHRRYIKSICKNSWKVRENHRDKLKKLVQ